MVRDVLTVEDIREAETLLDTLLSRFDTLVERRPGQRRLARDMTASESSSGSDQPEILYAASLSPELADTALFRKCAAFASAISGNVTRSFDHMIVKQAWNQSETPWHQDAVLAGLGGLSRVLQKERLHFWVPLQDVDERNGCMEFIPGSHKVPLQPHERFLRADGDYGLATRPSDGANPVACPIPTGGFTIHTPRTLHYTGRNATSQPRKAWIIHFSRFGQFEIALKRLFGRAPAPLGAPSLGTS